MQDFARKHPYLTVVVLIGVSLGLAFLLGREDWYPWFVFFLFLLIPALLIIFGAGRRKVEPNTVVIRKGPGDEIWAFTKKPWQPASVRRQQRRGPTVPLPPNTSDRGSYWLFPPWHKIEAILPTYPFLLEVDVKEVDTNTAWLNRMTRFRVRVECQLLCNGYVDFYMRTNTWLDRIKHYEEEEKLKRTDILLWKKLLHEMAHELIDNATRDVIWRWGERLADPRIVEQFSYKPEPPKKLDGDPYSLSRNRTQLEQEVAHEIRTKCHAWGIELAPIVFELVDVDAELIKKVNRSKDGEIAENKHKALQESEQIREKGFAEAEVRARNLAAVLDVLLNKEGLDLNDKLVTDIVRAALYSDGELIWNAVIDKGKGADGTVKAA